MPETTWRAAPNRLRDNENKDVICRQLERVSGLTLDQPQKLHDIASKALILITKRNKRTTFRILGKNSIKYFHSEIQEGKMGQN